MSPSLSDPKSVADRRRATHGLSAPRFDDAAEVVSFYVAVQAQDHRPAKWSLGLRTTGSSETEVESAYGEGRILRTHALRPTWHYLSPEDLRWVQGLTAKRVHMQNGTYYRKLGLDAPTLGRCHEVIRDALEGENHLTRHEIRERLALAGIEAEGQRLAYIMMHAELEVLVCSGRPRSQHTYALVDEWVGGAAPSLDEEQALARLTLAYFRSHGPSTDRDFSWWSSLKLSDARAGISLIADEMDQEVVDDVTYWWAPPSPGELEARHRANLIQALDEYVVGYRDTRSVIDLDGHYRATEESSSGAYDPLILDGQIVGRWRRRQAPGHLRAEIFPAFSLDQLQLAALNEEAGRLARFFGQDLELVT